MYFCFVKQGRTAKDEKYKIIAKNDGGIVVQYLTQNARNLVEWQPGGVRPVLGVEVRVTYHSRILSTNIRAKRMYARLRGSDRLENRLVGQIICEMLGQICHSQLYNNPDTEYQEVHSNLTLLLKFRHSHFIVVTLLCVSITPNFQTHI
jgi:hypothetical protein